MATARIWWTKGPVADLRNFNTSASEEPYLARQKLTTSAAAVASDPAPAASVLAWIETRTRTRYRVIRAGETGEADADDMPVTVGLFAIHCPAGARISLIEAA